VCISDWKLGDRGMLGWEYYSVRIVKLVSSVYNITRLKIYAESAVKSPLHMFDCILLYLVELIKLRWESLLH
jgi:hypothetical protein